MTCSSSSPSAPSAGASRAHDVVGERGARGLVAAVGDEHVLDLARRVRAAPAPRRAAAARAAPSVPGAVEVDDRGHAGALAAARPRAAQPIARARVELVGRVAVDVDLVAAEVGERERRRRRCRGSRRSPSCAPGSVANSATRASVCRLLRSWTATGSMIAGVTPSTSPVPRSARLDRGDVARAGTRRCRRPAGSASPSTSRHRAWRRARRSGRATAIDRGADRPVHRVAGDERRGDDRRAEHQPGDDQRRAARAGGRRCAGRAAAARGCGAPARRRAPRTKPTASARPSGERRPSGCRRARCIVHARIRHGSRTAAAVGARRRRSPVAHADDPVGGAADREVVRDDQQASARARR